MSRKICPTLFNDTLRASLTSMGEEYTLEVVDLCSRTVFRCPLGRWDSLRFVQLYAKLSYALCRPVGEVPVVWHGFTLTSCSLLSLQAVCEFLGKKIAAHSPTGDAHELAKLIIEANIWDD